MSGLIFLYLRVSLSSVVNLAEQRLKFSEEFHVQVEHVNEESQKEESKKYY